MPIRVLPPLLVNQIAAGEVVERPANVAKELIDNALDAGATRIEVEIEAGGRELIRVSDDGAGIAEEELALALHPHATSKIAAAEDLACIHSLGFRGEALASIASVSRLRLLSRPRGADSPAVIEAEGDRIDPVRPAAGPPGTTVTVRNLFFNTPARRRFLRGDQSEAGRVAETVGALAMANPRVGFRLIVDGRQTLDLPRNHGWRERVLAIIGEKLAPEMLPFGEPEGSPASSPGGDGLPASPNGWLRVWLRVWGLAGTPATARPGAKQLRLYVNRRPVQDRTVSHAIREAYRGLVDPARLPATVLFIEIDPHEVDVNVHPTKSEVRFRNGGAVHQTVQRHLRAALRAADLVPMVTWEPAAPPGSAPHAGSLGSTLPWTGRPHDVPPDRGADLGPSWSMRPDRGVDDEMAMTEARVGDCGGDSGRGLDDTMRRVDGDDRPRLAPVPILQAHRKYLVTEDPHGLLVVDQHALHERAMYETFAARLGEGALESQGLLAPAVLPADRARLEALEELAPILDRLGFAAAPGGPTTILLHAAPTLLHSRGVDGAQFLSELLDRAAAGSVPNERDAALVDVLSMMACKAAVKAGDRLGPAELADLLAQRERLERSSACPHGRPTSVRIPMRELDRWFAR